jgi:hypothetical protein
MLLNRAFGINTLSLYDDNYNIGAQPDLSKVVGHLSHGMQVKQLYQRARRSDGYRLPLSLQSEFFWTKRLIV